MTTKTEQKLIDLFFENTGTHFLDSGGTNGRAWQQNQALGVDLFLNRATGEIDEYGCISLNTFDYLKRRIELTPLAEELQRALVDFFNEDSERSPWALDDQLEALEAIGGEIKDDNGFNTYNWENFLDTVLQGYVFSYADKPFVLLQVHGGADVRGGYTHPQIFEINEGDVEWAWAYLLGGAGDCGLYCTNPECDSDTSQITIYGAVDVADRDGIPVNRIENDKCLNCGSPYEGEQFEPTY
jgi:hypothetical protein